MYFDPAYTAIVSIFLIGMALSTITGRAVPFVWISGCLSALLLVFAALWFAFYIIYVFFFLSGVVVGLAVNNAYRERPRAKKVAAVVMVAIAVAIGVGAVVALNA